MAYTELIKNFERIRDYMKEFYVYGFKSRDGYDKKSGRSYDNERRRVESYLGDYMGFRQTAAGKNVFLSIDSRSSGSNPLYKALKSKSFTDGDITLHFILLDILQSVHNGITLQEITDKLDKEYLSHFTNPMEFDESTVRKKLKEYVALGLLTMEKNGRQTIYRRLPDTDLTTFHDALAFFSETALCGVVGSFALDNLPIVPTHFSFKHHYITHALESEVLCNILQAMQEKRSIILHNHARRSKDTDVWEVVPLKIFISVQNGRRYLIGHNIRFNKLVSYRLDYIFQVQPAEIYPQFDELREKLSCRQQHMWGVSIQNGYRLEHVEFTIYIGDNEEYIYRRLLREKRCGTVELLDQHTCRFTAELYDSGEITTWIRSFAGRILSMDFSNRTVENRFKNDMEEMYQLYGLGGED